jgi:hypothetical protein
MFLFIDLEIVEGRFPQPKGTLHNLYAVVVQELKSSSYRLEKSYRMVSVRTGKVNNVMWVCTYKVKWPSEVSFSATMPTKAAAGKQAALKALHWLQAQGKLTKAGSPLMYDKSEIKEMTRELIEVTVDVSSCQDLDMLIEWYKKVCTVSNFVSQCRNLRCSSGEPVVTIMLWRN